MNPRLVEFALRKQRLQIHAEMQREDMAWRLAGITPALDRVDQLRDAVRWTRDHIPLLASSVLVVALLRPRLVLRVARRTWLGWLVYRRLRRRTGPLREFIARLRAPPPRGRAT
jgi:hypothetical protein